MKAHLEVEFVIYTSFCTIFCNYMIIDMDLNK